MPLIETTQTRYEALSRLTHEPVEVHRLRYKPGHMALIWRHGFIIQCLFGADEADAWLKALKWQALCGGKGD